MASAPVVDPAPSAEVSDVAVGMGRTLRVAANRLVDIALVILGVRIIMTADSGTFLERAGLWVIPAVAYLTVAFVIVRRARRRPVSEPMPVAPVRWRLLEDPRTHVAFSTMASLVGMTAGLFVVAALDAKDPDEALTIKAISLFVVVLSWLLLHTGYSRFYSGMLATQEPGALVFPECPWPGPVEFAYFSFTVGVTFAVSDVEIVSRRMRWHVLIPAVLSFVFNSAVIAIVVNVVSN